MESSALTSQIHGSDVALNSVKKTASRADFRPPAARRRSLHTPRRRVRQVMPRSLA